MSVRVVYLYRNPDIGNALVHAQGDDGAGRTTTVAMPDVRAIRRTLEMSQQRRRHPDAPAVAYLTAIANRPDAVREALLG
jgi:putative transcriptional regulator